MPYLSSTVNLRQRVSTFVVPVGLEPITHCLRDSYYVADRRVGLLSQDWESYVLTDRLIRHLRRWGIRTRTQVFRARIWCTTTVRYPIFVAYLGIEPSSSGLSSPASFVSPQTFIPAERAYLHFGPIPNVVSASGRLQHSHTRTRQRVCITFWPCGTGLYWPIDVSNFTCFV